MNQYELRELGQDEDFDPSSLSENVPFTQAKFYGDWQKGLGRTVRRFVISDGDQTVAYFQIIKYPLVSNKSYLYIPYGPVTKDISRDFFERFGREIRNLTKKEKAVFARLDFTPSIPDNILSKFFTKAPLYTYHSAYFQPRTEWFLNLGKTEEGLLGGMHKNTRYSIRQAEKNGVKAEIIKENFEKYFDEFYRLMSETSKRNGFSLHNKSYYENIFKNLSQSNSYLVIARSEEKILVIDVVIVFSKIANHVFGGSSDEERNSCASYAAKWEAIRYFKQLGLKYFNFGGVSTEDGAYEGWEGLTRFKKRFGGQEMVHSNFFDIVVDPLFYRLYNLRKFIKKFLG